MLRKPTLILLVLGLALCLGSALMATERDVVFRGVDLWNTPVSERTYQDFSDNPIPAGFFCSRSEAFTGTISFRGERLETSPAGAFGNADTVIERLDDAVFDHRGVARTRIQVRALSLVGTTPLDTACGSYLVTARLDGEQPITVMEIVRQGSIGGYFLAPLELDVKISFWPISHSVDFRSKAEASRGDSERAYRPLQLVQRIRLASNPQAGWTFFPGSDGVQHQEITRVDVDGDGIPETDLQGTSNFATGWWDNGGVPDRRNIYMSGVTSTSGVNQIPHGDIHSVQAPSYDDRKAGKK